MRKMKIAVAVMALSLLSTIPAMANWNKGLGANSNRWWYENEDHSYAHSGWFWLDGNNDGVAECYYFDQEGWALLSTTTPDGYTVNENGAWVVDGVVQSKSVEVKNVSKKSKKTQTKRKDGPIKEYKVHANNSSKGISPKQGEVNNADFNAEHPASTNEK